METPRSHTRPLQLSTRPPHLCLHLLTAPFPSPDPLPAKASPPPFFKKAASNSGSGGSTLLWGPSPQSPGKDLFSVARLRLGRWDLGATGLLRCEGTGLVCPKVCSILDIPVGGSEQVMRAVPLHL